MSIILLPRASIRFAGQRRRSTLTKGSKLWNENDRPYVYLPVFLDTGLPKGNVNERDSGPMRGACHPYPTPQPVKVGHTTGVYNPYSLRIVMFPQEEIIESALRHDLRTSLQRRHFLLSYLKTLTVGPAWVWTRAEPYVRLECAYTRFVPTRLPQSIKLMFEFLTFLGFIVSCNLLRWAVFQDSRLRINGIIRIHITAIMRYIIIV